jgi:hypothetical protein
MHPRKGRKRRRMGYGGRCFGGFTTETRRARRTQKAKERIESNKRKLKGGTILISDFYLQLYW